MQEKVISCGVIIKNELDEVLMCHVTGNDYFDFPKGVKEENETRIDCAIRETFEETGLDVDWKKLVNLGEFEYLVTKTLHLFQLDVRKDSIDFDKLKCNSYFIDSYSKEERLEVDYYQWIKAKEVFNNVNTRLKTTIYNNNYQLGFLR